MNIKASLAKVFAAWVHIQEQKWMNNPLDAQQKIFQNLISSAKTTQFGKDHKFDAIQNYEQFKSQVPIRDYEKLISYIEKVKAGDRKSVV